jgi:hypothetical protein
MADSDSGKIPSWLREAARSIEERAPGATVPGARQVEVESDRLKGLVDYATDRLAILRLKNLRDSLADVDDVLAGLRRELLVRRSEGRSARLTEKLVWEAEQERARILGMIASPLDLPGTFRRYPTAPRTSEVLGEADPTDYERVPQFDDYRAISAHFRPFSQPAPSPYYPERTREDLEAIPMAPVRARGAVQHSREDYSYGESYPIVEPGLIGVAPYDDYDSFEEVEPPRSPLRRPAYKEELEPWADGEYADVPAPDVTRSVLEGPSKAVSRLLAETVTTARRPPRPFSLRSSASPAPRPSRSTSTDALISESQAAEAELEILQQEEQARPVLQPEEVDLAHLPLDEPIAVPATELHSPELEPEPEVEPDVTPDVAVAGQVQEAAEELELSSALVSEESEPTVFEPAEPAAAVAVSPAAPVQPEISSPAEILVDSDEHVDVVDLEDDEELDLSEFDLSELDLEGELDDLDLDFGDLDASDLDLDLDLDADLLSDDGLDLSDFDLDGLDLDVEFDLTESGAIDTLIEPQTAAELLDPQGAAEPPVPGPVVTGEALVEALESAPPAELSPELPETRAAEAESLVLSPESAGEAAAIELDFSDEPPMAASEAQPEPVVEATVVESESVQESILETPVVKFEAVDEPLVEFPTVEAQPIEAQPTEAQPIEVLDLSAVELSGGVPTTHPEVAEESVDETLAIDLEPTEETSEHTVAAKASESETEPVIDLSVFESEPVEETFESSADQPELIVEAPAVEPEPVIEAAAVEPELIVEAPAVEPEPVIEAPTVAPEPVIEALAVESEPVIEAPTVESEPVIEAPTVESEPVIEAPAVEPELITEAPTVEPEPVIETLAVETELVIEAPVVEPEPSNEAPAVEPESVVETPDDHPGPVIEALGVETEPDVETSNVEPEPHIETPDVELELTVEARAVESEPLADTPAAELGASTEVAVESESVAEPVHEAEAEPVVGEFQQAEEDLFTQPAQEPAQLEAVPAEERVPQATVASLEAALFGDEPAPALEAGMLAPSSETPVTPSKEPLLGAAHDTLFSDDIFAPIGGDLFGSGEIPTAEQFAPLEGSSDLFGPSAEYLGGGLFEDTGEVASWLTDPLAEENVAEGVLADTAVQDPEMASSEPPKKSQESPGASTQERRRLVRLQCDQETFVYLESRATSVRLQDISLGGCKVVASPGFQRGQILLVANPLSDKKEEADAVKGRAVWIKPSMSQTGKQDIGLVFEESPEVLGRSWVISLLNKIGMQAKVFNQRKYTRAVANLPIEIEMQSKEMVAGLAFDLGLGGALLSVNRPFTPTTRFRMSVGPFGSHEVLTVRCEVISSRPAEEEGKGWSHSVKFVELSTVQTRLLGKYVVDLLKTAGSVP